MIEPLNRKTLLILVGILLVGAGLRAIYFAERVPAASFQVVLLDEAYHSYWAKSLATGTWGPPPLYDDPQISTTPYFRPPGYPYFLAGLYRLTGSSHAGAVVLQMLLGLGNCILAFVFARRWLGTRVALLTAAGMAFYWTFIYYEAELLEPTLLVTTSLLVMLAAARLVDRPTLPRVIVTGLLIGLLALVRPNLLLFAIFILLWLFWILRRQGESRQFPLAAILLLTGTAIAIAAATLRNRIVTGEWVLISSNAGVNLYIGNNPYADGYSAGAPGVSKWSCFDYPRIKDEVEREVGQPLSYSQLSAHFADKAWTYIREQPVKTLRLVGQKALLFWGPMEVGNEKEDEIVRDESRLLRRLPGAFWMILGTAACGLAMLYADRRASTFFPRAAPVAILVLIFMFTVCVSYLPFFVAGRYRVPVTPFLLMLASYAAVSLWNRVGTRWGEVAAWTAAVVAACWLASINFGGYLPRYLPHVLTEVQTCHLASRPAELIDATQRLYPFTKRIVQSKDPVLLDGLKDARLWEADAWLQLGRPERAIATLEKCLALDPLDRGVADALDRATHAADRSPHTSGQ